MGFLRRHLEGDAKTATVTLIGPPKAGKTTLVRYIETGEEVEKSPSTTLGIEIRSNFVDIDGWKFRAIDTGGQEVFQQTFWELAVERADLVLFVIDATVKMQTKKDLFELTKEQFDYALDIVPESIPIVFLLNKQDLQNLNPMNPEEAINMFDFKNLAGRTITYFTTSAKFGNGVEEVFVWMIDYLKKTRGITD